MYIKYIGFVNSYFGDNILNNPELISLQQSFKYFYQTLIILHILIIFFAHS